MVPTLPSKKQVRFLLIALIIVSITSGTASAATTSKSSVAKKTTTSKTAAVKVKGESVSADKVTVVGDNRITTYTVKKGDTLSGIAKKFGITVNTIRWSNNIKSTDSIKAGEKLTILPSNGVKYTVKKGDTLSAIAVRFAADQSDILNANDLANANSLKIGMVLIIPDVEPNDEAPATTTTTSPEVQTATVEPVHPIVITTPTSVTVIQPQTVQQTPVGTTMLVKNPVTTEAYAVTVTAPTVTTPITIPTADIRGYYAQPISGRLSQGIHDVNAVDISAPVGTTVHAAAEGMVIVAMGNGAYNGGYGNYIVISHPNGTQTLYAHLSKVTVKLGETVVQGEPIGLSGRTGKVTGAHLHFEVRGGTNPWGADSIGTTYSI